MNPFQGLIKPKNPFEGLIRPKNPFEGLISPAEGLGLVRPAEGPYVPLDPETQTPTGVVVKDVATPQGITQVPVGERGAEEPSALMDPVNLMVDLGTGFATAPMRMAGKKGLQALGALGKNVVQDVGYGAAASAAMDAAPTDDPIVKTLAAFGGPVAVQGVRRGVAETLKRSFRKRPGVAAPDAIQEAKQAIQAEAAANRPQLPDAAPRPQADTLQPVGKAKNPFDGLIPETKIPEASVSEAGETVAEGSLPTLRRTAEDFEINPDKMRAVSKVANMDTTTGRVYAYAPGESEVFNHADIMTKHRMVPENTITGFVDDGGKFYYQYPEEAQKMLGKAPPKEVQLNSNMAGLQDLGQAYTKHIGDPVWDFFAEKAPKAVGDKVPAVDWINRKLITDYGKPEAYTKAREKTKIDIEALQEKSVELADKLAQFSTPEQKRISQIVRGGVTNAPERYADALQAVKEFEGLEKDLRDLGVLKGTTYLTQYTRKQRADLKRTIDNPASAWSKNRPPRKSELDDIRNGAIDKLQQHYASSGEKYLKRSYEKWEQSAGFKRMIADWPFVKKPVRMGMSYTKRRQDIPYEVRKQMGEIETAPYLVGKGLLEQYHDREMAKLFGDVARNPEWATGNEADAVAKGFRQLPDSPKLGELSGKYVDKYIYEDINDAVKVSSSFGAAYDKILGAWKAGKVIYNPATWSRNIMSNIMLADMIADMPLSQSPIWLTKAAREVAQKGADYQELKGLGKLNREWYGAEVKRFLGAVDEAKPLAENEMAAVIQGLWRAAGKTTDRLGRGYQGVEQIFKVAVFKYRKAMGDSTEQAADMAEKALFDYSKVPQGIKWAKRWYSPFITFTYKALPRFAETAVRKPWKIAKYIIIAQAIEGAAQKKFGETDKQASLEKSVRPDWMKRQTFPGIPSHLRLPARDERGTKYLDLSYTLPWGDIGEQWGQSDMPLRPLFPSHPALTMIGDFAHNREAFSDRKITKPWMSTSQKVKKVAGYIWRQTMPSLAGSWGYEKLKAGATGKKDYMGREFSLPEAVLDSIFGVKLRSVNVGEETVKRAKEFERTVSDMAWDYKRERLNMMRAGAKPKALREYDAEYRANLERLVKQYTDMMNPRGGSRTRAISPAPQVPTL